MPLSKTYNASEYEDSVYKQWEESGAFNPDSADRGAKPFSIAMPPPNATGTLHIGHSMMLVLQDLMIRYHRMIGDKTLWLPGTDHASIATQNKVEKMLAKEGRTRHELGREQFIAHVETYVAESRARIRTQIRKVGASCDWSRERYTLDKGLSRAVNEVFVRMYNDGLIYRDYRMVNWCPRCHSTLSDDEVKYKPETTKFYYFKFGPVIIGTARPETKFQDKTIVVHPDDPRYKDLIGKEFMTEWIEGPISAHVIADPIVDQTFGTGAMTITPAHSFEDFDLAKKYHRPVVKIIDEDGNLTKEAGDFAGKNARESREAIIEKLKAKGVVDHIDEQYQHNLSVCYRCDTPVEPLPSLQWFVNVNAPTPRGKKSLKELMRTAVESKRITIIPHRFEKIYYHWIDNLRDWCISRQIWFGHQLPVYYCKKEKGGCGETVVSADKPDFCQKCKKETLIQDEDTFDTWFSSGLWTFSTLGWPDAAEEKAGKVKKTGDLATFHPTSVMETGYDILFFWVARMILMSEYVLGEEPFRTVYLHGLVLDIEGKKMSKTKEETLIDPLDVIPKYGADALRASMVVGVTPGNDLRLNEEKIASYRNFVNKLWNIGRYIIEFSEKEPASSSAKQGLSTADAWIISRLNVVVEEVTTHIKQYRFSQAAEALRSYTWDELADWYVECAKVEGGKRPILFSLLRAVLALWHPFIPFVTEVLYQQYREAAKDLLDEKTEQPPLLITHPWPHVQKKYTDKKAEEDFTLIRTIIQAIRNARVENGISASQKIQAVLYSPARSELLQTHEPHLKRLASLDFVTIIDKGDRPSNAIFLKIADVEVYLPLGLMRIEEEKTKIAKQLAETQSQIESLRARLADQQFLAKAPKNIVKKEQEHLAELQDKITHLQEQQEKFTA
ncbi:valine--tRNA ligase [Candidatus Uhrbacteria bacterium]|nr:valine--tRNA ligase [Candidatus Uhrbacteria bacterium]